MNKVIEIVNQLRNTPSTNDKIAILKKNRNNELLKMTLEYTYNPFKKYGLSEKTINPIECEYGSVLTIFEICDELASSNINDSLRNMVNKYLGYIWDAELRDLYTCIILKDLKIGCNSKTINKVWKNLIPEFNVMLAHSFFKDNNGDKIKSEFIVSTKLDGHRLVGIKENGTVKFYTRQGQQVDGLIEIEEDFKSIPNGVVLDGELLLRNDKNLPSDELYRATTKVARKDGVKKNLEFHVFDYVSLEGFKKGIDKTPCIKRKELLHDLIINNDFKTIKEVEPLYIGKDKDKIIELLNKAKDNNQEGVMVNVSSGEYQCKRSKEILKVKVFLNGDMRVVDIIEGTGKNEGKLGAITVEFEHEGKIYRCDCGSGFKDTERSLYWNNPELILNKIVVINYFEISTNQQGGVGLRFPTWCGRITDKAEISMY